VRHSKTPPSSASGRIATLVVTLASAFAVIVALAAGEFAFRYRERHRSSVPNTFDLIFYPHVRLGHGLVRSADYFDWIHTDSAGFRGTRQVSAAKQAGVFRIMIVGSSTTFDSFVGRDEYAWPTQLEQRLRALTGRTIEVINAGVPGYTLLDDQYRLTTELYVYKPDLLILYEGHNDLLAAIRRGPREDIASGQTPGERDTATPWGQWLGRHSMLYSKVLHRWDAIQFRRTGERVLSRQRDPKLAADATLDHGVERFGRDLGAFLATSRALGLRVVVPQLVQASGAGSLSEPDSTTRGLWAIGVPFATPETVLRGYVRFDSVATAVAREYGATHITTASFGLHGMEWYSPGDPVHFNAKGAAKMADEMSRALVAAGALAP
jgi:lysophospholipase L1-like esterase